MLKIFFDFLKDVFELIILAHLYLSEQEYLLNQWGNIDLASEELGEWMVLEVSKWRKNSGQCQDMSEDVCSFAAARGFLHVLQWARSQGYDWNQTTCDNAA